MEVIPCKLDPQQSVWHGGVLLGVLDFAQEAFVLREDWVEHGAGANPHNPGRLQQPFSHANLALWHTSAD